MLGRLSNVTKVLGGAVAVVATLALIVPDFADARAGRSGNAGSRGDRTFQAPPSTNTAPKTTSPIEKSITQPGKAAAGAGAAAAGTAAAATQASRFGGLKGILMGGLIGAALASFLGAGALASILGGILWFLLIGAGIMLIVALFRGRFSSPQPALAQASAGAQQAPPQNQMYRQAGGPVGAAAVVNIVQDDFNAFERLLGEVQDAYSRADIDALGKRTTPEMLSYFAHELDENKRNGVRNEVTGVKLLQGDLAEAWREQGGEYATVAMRYALTDVTVDRTGRIVAGDRTPTEATEVWTFYRPNGGNAGQWELSAIQQA